MNNTQENLKSYEQYYSELKLFPKIYQIYNCLSKDTLKLILSLYACLRDKSTPFFAKSIIIGAFGYLILPMDVSPDMIPGIGLTDDALVLTYAAYQVQKYLKDKHRTYAEYKIDQMIEKKEKRKK